MRVREELAAFMLLVVMEVIQIMIIIQLRSYHYLKMIQCISSSCLLMFLQLNIRLPFLLMIKCPYTLKVFQFHRGILNQPQNRILTFNTFAGHYYNLYYAHIVRFQLTLMCASKSIGIFVLETLHHLLIIKAFFCQFVAEMRQNRIKYCWEDSQIEYHLKLVV